MQGVALAPAAGARPVQRLRTPQRAARCPGRTLRGCHASTSAPAAIGTRRVEYTALEGNAWKLRLASSGVTVLADPWLVGPLVFGPPQLAVLYSATKPSGDSLGIASAAGADVLLLTQGLDDHAHRPTLRALAAVNPALPVVASPAGAAVARECGFADVTAVAPGARHRAACGVTFAATQGALVGPPWSTRENGFLVSEDANPEGVCVYYEPHCDYQESSVRAALQACGRAVDLVIAPCTAVALAGYPLVLGSPDSVLRLLRLLRPRVLVPLRNDVIAQSGAIAPAIGESGGVEAVRAALAADKELSGAVRLLEAAPAGQPLVIDL